MHITALAGGVGGARFLRGVRHHLHSTEQLADTTVTVVGNTGDDITPVSYTHLTLPTSDLV